MSARLRFSPPPCAMIFSACCIDCMSVMLRFAMEEDIRAGSGVCRMDCIWIAPLDDFRGVIGDFGGLWGVESKSEGRDCSDGTGGISDATAFPFPFAFPGFAT